MHFVLLCEKSIRYFVQKYAFWDVPFVLPSHFLMTVQLEKDSEWHFTAEAR